MFKNLIAASKAAWKCPEMIESRNEIKADYESIKRKVNEKTNIGRIKLSKTLLNMSIKVSR